MSKKPEPSICMVVYSSNEEDNRPTIGGAYSAASANDIAARRARSSVASIMKAE